MADLPRTGQALGSQARAALHPLPQLASDTGSLPGCSDWHSSRNSRANWKQRSTREHQQNPKAGYLRGSIKFVRLKEKCADSADAQDIRFMCLSVQKDFIKQQINRLKIWLESHQAFESCQSPKSHNSGKSINNLMPINMATQKIDKLQTVSLSQVEVNEWPWGHPRN